MSNPDRSAQPDIHRSEQGVLNKSFDETYQVLAVENLVYNPTTNSMDRMTQAGGSDDTATSTKQVEQIEVLEEIEHALQSIAATKGIASDIRVTLLGGTTAVTGSLTGVTTVTTVTGLTNIGGIPAVPLVSANQNTTAVLSNINNVNV